MQAIEVQVFLQMVSLEQNYKMGTFAKLCFNSFLPKQNEDANKRTVQNQLHVLEIKL